MEWMANFKCDGLDGIDTIQAILDNKTDQCNGDMCYNNRYIYIHSRNNLFFCFEQNLNKVFLCKLMEFRIT